MNFFKKILGLFLVLMSNYVFAQIEPQTVWQWSISVDAITSGETNAAPRAFLWIPPNCKQVRGVVLGQHNMLEEGIMEHRAFRANLARLGFAEIWLTPSIDMVFDFKKNPDTEVFNKMMLGLAHISGYKELEFAPIIPIGHSAAASYPWNFAAWNPGRTLAMLSIHGDVPLTNMTGSGRPNPDWGDRNIDGIPGLFVMGEYEWLEGRIKPAFEFKKLHPKSTVAYLCDAGNGHFDFSDELIGFLNLFLNKAAKERLPATSPIDRPVILKAVDPTKGWLVDRWRNNQLPTAASAPFISYTGHKEEAGWAFDRDMAIATERYYTKDRAKQPQYIGYVQNGKLLPLSSFAGFSPKFIPLPDGLTFHLSTRYLDSVAGKPVVKGHSVSKIDITRICGPVIKVNDTTFKIAFYRMGFNNQKRSGDIWFMARSGEDAVYKSAVQQANMKIPIHNTEGADQHIDFPKITLPKGAKQILLSAVSDSGEPVSYYVKEGPAYVEGSLLHLTNVPPRAKYPLKVTVVAWQYGRNFAQKLKSALPVEQNFYLEHLPNN